MRMNICSLTCSHKRGLRLNNHVLQKVYHVAHPQQRASSTQAGVHIELCEARFRNHRVAAAKGALGIWGCIEGWVVTLFFFMLCLSKYVCAALARRGSCKASLGYDILFCPPIRTEESLK